LEEQAKTCSVLINQAIDSANLSKNLSHTTFGCKVCDMEAYCPTTKKLLYGSTDSTSIQSHNNCFSFMILMAKESKKLSTRWSQSLINLKKCQSMNGWVFGLSNWGLTQIWVPFGNFLVLAVLPRFASFHANFVQSIDKTKCIYLCPMVQGQQSPMLPSAFLIKQKPRDNFRKLSWAKSNNWGTTTCIWRIMLLVHHSNKWRSKSASFQHMLDG